MTIIATSFGSLNPGGGEYQNCRLLINFQKKGYEVHAVLPNGAGNMEGNLKPYLKEHGIPMYSAETIPDKTQGMTPIFKKIKPDVTIHAGYPMTLHGAIAALNAGVSRRIIRMETSGLVRQQCPQTPLMELMGHAAAEYVVGNSQAVVDSFDIYHGICDCKKQMIPNGVDIPELRGLRKKSRAYFGVDEGMVLIGHLANFRQDGVKNQLMLVRAAKRLLDQDNDDFVLVMCGYSTAYQAKVEAEIEALGVGEHVWIPGRIDDLDLLAGWDIGVNASTTEGFSNALQECMAYGMPIVATEVGGNGESVQDGKTGYLVPSGDDEAMASALLKLIKNDKSRKKMGMSARYWMRDTYGWDAIIKQWEALF